jgi:transcriptional regulator with GAF, ATPase, and Fis domain
VPEAYLLILSPGVPLRTESLRDDIVTVGNSDQATICLNDGDAAPLHAEIRQTPKGFVFMRKASPAWVNGRRAAAQPLSDGDLIVLGRTALSYRKGKPPQRASSPSSGSAEPGQEQRAYKALRSLYDFTRQLMRQDSSMPLTPMAEKLLSELVDLTGGSCGMMVLFDGATYRMAGDISTRHGDFDGKELQLSHTALAKLKQDPRPQLWSDIAYDADLAHAPSLHGANVRSLMAAPIQVGEQMLGALYVSKGETRKLFDQQALDLMALFANQLALLLASANRDQELADKVEKVQRDLELMRQQTIVGSSTAMQQMITNLRKVARSTISVLLLGETGSGKELLAREIHRNSDRADKPFVAVNCGAIPGQLLESELFGHKRGAFTGATEDRIGRIRSAAGGVLFLDEIGEMPLEQQAKLLRVLEQREVRPVGGDRSFAVDFRLICATNVTVNEQVEAGRFRQDLYYRIADFVLKVPPLRERDDDAVELARFFLKKQTVLLDRGEVQLSASAMTSIRRHKWPGNVRELAAAVRRSLVLCEGDTITPSDLGLKERTTEPEAPIAQVHTDPNEPVMPLAQARDNFLKQYVDRAVQQCGGNRTEAAKLLMVTPRTIFKYLEEV